MLLYLRDNDKTDKNGCPIEQGQGTLYDHGTAHSSLYYVSAACAAVTLISGLGLIFQHLRRYRVPQEQRQIVRITFTPFAFSIVAFASIADYNIAPYIDPLGEYYSAFCLTALFLLYVQFAAPESEYGESMFQAMQGAADTPMKDDGNNWPKISWIAVFQYPLTETLAIIVLEATEAGGVYCANSLKPSFGHLWVQLIKTIGLALCFITVLRFYKRTKSLLKARKATSKLVCFKGIVAIRFVQTWLFNILIDHSVIKTSKQFSFGDLLYGIPNTLLAAEMVLFSLGFWYAYSSSEYSSKAKPHKQTLNFFRAILDASNPSDILLGILRIFSLLTGITAGRQGYQAPQYVQPGTYGRLDSPPYRPGGNRRGPSVPEGNYGGYAYQPRPQMYIGEGADEGERYLMADAGGPRTPSPARY